jgi:demethylmenaquinone methyltransferase/2-methoxy-6-polyprenyl-1,4-benzoquinol methylase
MSSKIPRITQSGPGSTLAADSNLVEPGSGAMFDAIARRYDLLNRLISLGIDQSWRKQTVRSLALPAEGQVLDLATGTADLAILIAETHPEATVVGVDPSTQMLAVGREKLERRGLLGRVELVPGIAESLPFEDAEFAGLTMAFGIRNVPDRPRALAEMVRVIRPGSRVCILELSEPKHGLLASLARFHMHRVVPLLGAALSGAGAYRYLPNSIHAFPDARTFSEMMRAAGFASVEVHALTFGVCHLYVGTVP